MPTIEANAKPQTWIVPKRDPVKLTALLYLKEALGHQRYESCKLFIAIAKEFGAFDQEIQELLEDPRRMPR